MLNKPINKILIIRLSSLGDILLTTPIIKAIKSEYKDAQIDFILRKEYTDVILYNKAITQILMYENENASVLKNQVRNSQYDLIIDLQNNFRSRSLFSGIRTVIRSFKKPTLKKLLLVRFKIKLLKNGKTIVQRYAEAAKVKLISEELELIIPAEVKATLDDRTKYLGFCPGARHFTKRWPAGYFIELGKILTQKGFTIVLFGGKADKDICEMISGEIPGSINLQNEDNLLQTAVEMKKCKIVITNDSGLMHTAVAVNVPVAAIFGSTVKEFGFAPSGIRNLILENKSLSCRPCSHIGKSVCPKKHFRCMKEIKAGDVLNNIKTFIE